MACDQNRHDDAYASTDTAVKAIRLGALDYLPKPFYAQ